MDKETLFKWMAWIGGVAALLAPVLGYYLVDDKTAKALSVLVALILVAVLGLLFYRGSPSQPPSDTPKTPGEDALPDHKAALRFLFPIEEGDQLLGRNVELADLYTRIPAAGFRFGVLCGESGCGKTSLLRAGLLPRLRSDGRFRPVYLPGTGKVPKAAIHTSLSREAEKTSPDAAPAIDLEGLLRSVAGPARTVVLICDQFEEFFIANRTLADRTPFLQWVGQWVRADSLPVIFLFGLRSDFFIRMHDFRPYVEDPTSTRVTSELRNFDYPRAMDVLRKAAAHDRADFADDLIKAIIEDLLSDEVVRPSDLQIVATLLKRRGVHTVAEYRRSGGAHGQLQSYIAEEVRRAANPNTARGILRALCPPVGDTRHPTDLGFDAIWQFVKNADAKSVRGLRGHVQTILNQFQEDRLVLRTEEGKYNLPHDRLVRPLREWLNREREKSWQSRAELRLEERTAEWRLSRKDRYLPSWWEYLSIVFTIPRKRRSTEQQDLMRRARRYYGLRWGCALALAAVMGFILYRYYDSVQEAHAEELVNAVLTTSPAELPNGIEKLQSYRRRALPLLDKHFRDPSLNPARRLRAAEAQAALGGEIDQEYLMDRIPTIPALPEECRNMVTALAPVKDAAAAALLGRIEAEADAEKKARFAIVLLHLGDPRGARSVLRLLTDPKDRTAFIHRFQSWHGELTNLPEILQKEQDSELRSGLAAALGEIDPTSLSESEQQQVHDLLADLYVHSPDGATHSAAGWALRRWKKELPPIAPARQAAAGFTWFVTKQQMTMIVIQPGNFIMGDSDPENNFPQHPVTLTRPFALCDREISVGQFQQFIDDPDPDVWKPQKLAFPAFAASTVGLLGLVRDQGPFLAAWASVPGRTRIWTGPEKVVSPNALQPVQQVSWIDAVLFCNWLSHKEGRTPCYHRSGVKTRKDDKNNELTWEVWTCDFSADGYRLPTEAEWEYACRAGTKTRFSFGDDDSLLTRYARSSNGFIIPTLPCASLLPNGWGLFDMHGNVWELCWDWNALDTMPVTDPRGPEDPRIDSEKDSGNILRVCRGGGIANSSGDPDSADRDTVPPHFRESYNLGFRVACSVGVTPPP
jgi:formylglycine-generating enzyme required for sulfatase activity